MAGVGEVTSSQGVLLGTPKYFTVLLATSRLFYEGFQVSGFMKQVKINLKPQEDWLACYKRIYKMNHLKPREDGPAGYERPRQAGEPREVRGEELPH